MKLRKSFSLITILFVVLGFTELAQAFYNPETGSFLSRDPIEERGGENLYGFVRNDGVNGWDYLGYFKPNQEIDVKCQIDKKDSNAGKIKIINFGVMSAGVLNGFAVGQGKFEMIFTPDPKSCCCANGKYRWYQTIVHDDEGGKVPRPDVGGGAGKPNLAPSYNLTFLDMPTLYYATLDKKWAAKYNNGKGKNEKVSAKVEFKLELQCENGKSISTFKTIDWGFKGTLDVNIKKSTSNYVFNIY